ncbi:MAG: hypothetical protein J1F02_00720 [Lachnospiraceae bacterium]|nr:hypothetical protein [Lachnospiraceae bacterium]
MEREECWDNFFRTGRVADYLEYVRTSRVYGMNSVKEERGQREGTSDGDGALSRNHR